MERTEISLYPCPFKSGYHKAVWYEYESKKQERLCTHWLFRRWFSTKVKLHICLWDSIGPTEFLCGDLFLPTKLKEAKLQVHFMSGRDFDAHRITLWIETEKAKYKRVLKFNVPLPIKPWDENTLIFSKPTEEEEEKS